MKFGVFLRTPKIKTSSYSLGWLLHTSAPTFLSFIEAVLSIETVAVVVQGTHREKRRSKTS